jgi:hypothetical protein
VSHKAVLVCRVLIWRESPITEPNQEAANMDICMKEEAMKKCYDATKRHTGQVFYFNNQEILITISQKLKLCANRSTEQLCGQSFTDLEHSSRYYQHFKKPLFQYYLSATGTVFDLDQPSRGKQYVRNAIKRVN